ncbi:MAG: branched-chain amino acid ABC transporter permease [Xanthobacteraceae bacterium]
MTWRIALQLALSGLSVGSIYAIVALSLAIPFKASRVLNFAQGELVTLGAYIALVLSSYGLPYPVMVPATLVIAALFGILIERLFIRPIVGAPEFTLVIATFAIGLIIRALIRIHWQDNVFFLPAPYAGPALAIGPLRVNPSYLVIIGSTAALVTLLILFFQQTRLGKAMRAVAYNRTAARLMGISVGRVFGSALALSAAIGALAGLLLAPVIGINPEFGHVIVKALVAAVIGGFGSLGGAVVGGLLLGILETYAGAMFGAALKEIIPFAILIAFLLVRPQGLWGATQVRV